MREYSKQFIPERKKKSIVLNNSTPYKLVYFFILLCCLYMCVCSHVGGCVYMCAHVYRIQRLCSVALSQRPSILGFETGPLSVLNFVDQARLAGPRAPGMHPVLSHMWDSKNIPPWPAFSRDGTHIFMSSWQAPHQTNYLLSLH